MGRGRGHRLIFTFFHCCLYILHTKISLCNNFQLDFGGVCVMFLPLPSGTAKCDVIVIFKFCVPDLISVPIFSLIGPVFNFEESGVGVVKGWVSDFFSLSNLNPPYWN